MIQQRFDYHAPRSIDEALGLLAAAGEDCAVLGGGTWLIPNMTYAITRPTRVLDPRRLNLETIAEDGDALWLGARVTYAAAMAAPVVATHAPLLASMARQITGGVSIVGQGTIGGSACYANPSSDVPACLLALGARLRLASTRGSRDLEAAEFFRGAFTTARRPDEMLLGIVIPKASPTRRHGYAKLKFSTGSWPIVTAAVTIDRDADGDRVRAALGAATGAPLLSEALLPVGAGLDVIENFAAGFAARVAADEWADELAGPGYRRRVAASIVLRALQQCAETA